jgi:hypothetical protein
MGIEDFLPRNREQGSEELTVQVEEGELNAPMFLGLPSPFSFFI